MVSLARCAAHVRHVFPPPFPPPFSPNLKRSPPILFPPPPGPTWPGQWPFGGWLGADLRDTGRNPPKSPAKNIPVPRGFFFNCLPPPPGDLKAQKLSPTKSPSLDPHAEQAPGPPPSNGTKPETGFTCKAIVVDTRGKSPTSTPGIKRIWLEGHFFGWRAPPSGDGTPGPITRTARRI